MINSVTPSSPFAELTADNPAKPPVAEIKPPAPAPEAVQAAPSAETGRDLRLLIEFDKQRGYYVYRLIDRQTGTIVTSIPRGDIGKMAASADYEAGGVISTSA